MKKQMLIFCLLLIAAFALSACGEEPIDPGYTSSAVTLRSFTEIAGENPDSLKEKDGDYVYTYQIKDGDVGAAAFNLYKDYLDENFSYSPIDSSVDSDAYILVYDTADKAARIVYSESVAKDGAYTVSVRFPK